MSITRIDDFKKEDSYQTMWFEELIQLTGEELAVKIATELGYESEISVGGNFTMQREKVEDHIQTLGQSSEE